jgi:tRNA A37 threonylcarbamoyladenosine dehydratase
MPVEPAKLTPEDPISIAVAAIAKTFFMSLSKIVRWGLRKPTSAG